MSAATSITMDLDRAVLHGDLVVPDGSSTIVVFAHGAGSSRFSPRNRRVAQTLDAAGHGTLLLDLLTEREEALDARTAQLRFDLDLLAGRLVQAVEWLDHHAGTAQLAVGYFGASTGAGAALAAAATQGDRIRAVVSRGGRPDLAGAALSRVTAPTLLIVGGRDDVVLGLNEQAAVELRCQHRLEVIAGATHLFEEPGALDQVAALAGGWFSRHLTPMTSESARS
jgi:putative phosphoribosyl transferase